ncbi:MAG: ABC transporter permease subunit [Rhodospirillales bacterium]|nr:ABC transporter permease subunit [Rhodospirillales bacterium]
MGGGTAITATAADTAERTAPRVSLWTVYSAAASLILVFAVVTPVLICLWGSFTTLSTMGAASTLSGAGWETQKSLGIYASGARETTGPVTLIWYQYVFEVYGHTIGLSLKLAFISIAATIVLGVFGGYGLVRYDFPGKALLEEVISIPLSLPGISIAVALLGTYGMIRDSWTIILLGHLLYTLPFMLQSVTSTLRSYNFFELERAAASLGANWFQRLRYILLPNLRHAIIIGSLLVFTISLGEFNASFLLTTPINLTLPASLYDTYTNDSFQVSSAATSVFMLVVVPVLMAIQFMGGKEMKEIGQAA